MPKSITLGNGSIHIGLDKYGQVSDFYFPFVGLENHVGGNFLHKIGVYTKEKFAWFDDPSWKITVLMEENTMASNITAENEELKLKVELNDIVYNEKNIFVRELKVNNLDNIEREIKIFFDQQFLIYESIRGDTAYFDPKTHAIIHYEGRRMFLVNCVVDGMQFDQYATGLLGIEGHEGTYKDAEDGVLSFNPIEYGLVDSVVGVTLKMKPLEQKLIYYWICVSKLTSELYDLNKYVIDRTPEHLIKTTKDFWRAWVNKQTYDRHTLTPETFSLFKKSLFTIRTHVDNNGAIIASGDSDLLKKGRDTYGYVWQRDGAFTSIALDKAGYYDLSRNFFEFSNEVIREEGFFMHKYRADKSLGSSWHPWLRGNKVEYPIQEDETALVIYALWEHYRKVKDLEFIERIYNSLIKKAAEFMVSYVSEDTGLPKPSYDLWEEKFGVSTFTACTVYAGLNAAANFAQVLGKTKSESLYRGKAEQIRQSIIKYLYSKENTRFYKSIDVNPESKEFLYDATLDMSTIYGIFKFDILNIDDEMITKEMQIIENELMTKDSPCGGIPRYQHDIYYKVSDKVQGNPWIITSLWMGQYYIKKAKNLSELELGKKWIDWAISKAAPSGVLPEQLNPDTCEALSATPLTWSHSEFITTVIEYIDKAEKFKEYLLLQI